ncbi:MAG: DNA primase, partial [Clostridia bacterium]|nr:DNA primase [Clostridia bacterium]
MPLISQNVIEEIKLRCEIYDVVSTYVTLKRAGSNYVGLCPFHSEKTPSFTVFPDSQNFYCFGCGAGGDQINFIRKIENLDYVSAVELLAKRAGVTIQTSSEDANLSRKRERTLQMNKIAARYFNHVLLETEEGKPGLNYLLSRKLTIPLIRHFGLGFAPSRSNELINILRSNGYSVEEMTESYL